IYSKFLPIRPLFCLLKKGEFLYSLIISFRIKLTAHYNNYPMINIIEPIKRHDQWANFIKQPQKIQ
ncbi:hypothetical protein, partial [Riemerella anatipestifer]|uniref:hypothetical protein n=1 Tax=Riemerella anatipestifer TaxID=34085 RepID=UPI001C87A237